MAKPTMLHPFLIAVYPPLALYAYRINEIPFKETIPTFIALLVTATLALLFCWFIIGNVYRAGVVTSIFLIWCFSYGPVSYFLEAAFFGYQLRGGPFWSVWLLCFGALAIWTIRSRSSCLLATKALNAAAIVLVAWPVLGVVTDFVGRSGTGQVSAGTTATGQDDGLKVVGTPRDIYYLIFDRYGSASTLRDEYGFDNTPFLQFLEERGFYIADGSAANYLRTAHSLASSLNMEHITYLSREVGEASRDWRPLYEKLQNFSVWRLLEEEGYKYVHLGSWWAPTARNRYADENFSGDIFDEFSAAVLKETTIHGILTRIGLRWLNGPAMQCRRVPAKLEKIREIARREEPTFVFAHFLIPHEPYVFGPDGDCILEDDDRSERDKYIGQVQFANTRISELVDALLRGAEVEPIIIIQADEGPFPARYEKNQADFDWREARPEEIQQKFKILNAFHLPGIKSSKFHQKITPVNTFRIIFNEYFNGSFPLLPDRSYASVDEDHLYQFFDVTGIISMGHASR